MSYSKRDRALTLCNILATGQSISTLVKLCEAWGVDPALYHGAMDRLETIQRLALAVVGEPQATNDPANGRTG